MDAIGAVQMTSRHSCRTGSHCRCGHITGNSPQLPAAGKWRYKNGLPFRNGNHGNCPPDKSCLAIDYAAASARKRLRRSALRRKRDLGCCRAHRTLHFAHLYSSAPLDKCMKHLGNHCWRPSTHFRNRPGHLPAVASGLHYCRAASSIVSMRLREILAPS